MMSLKPPRVLAIRSIRFVPILGFLVLLVMMAVTQRSRSATMVDAADVAAGFLISMSFCLAVILISLLAQISNFG